jgi:hypothetical protein
MALGGGKAPNPLTLQIRPRVRHLLRIPAILTPTVIIHIPIHRAVRYLIPRQPLTRRLLRRLRHRMRLTATLQTTPMILITPRRTMPPLPTHPPPPLFETRFAALQSTHRHR